MTRLDLVLTLVLIAGVAASSLTLFTNVIIDRRPLENLTSGEISRAVPYWRTLAGLLGFAAIVFAIHALLFIHGIVGTPRHPLFYAAVAIVIVLFCGLMRKR